MKRSIILVLLISLIALSLAGCTAGKRKEFNGAVDRFCKNYDRFSSSNDPSTQDVGLTNCVYALEKMAELYEDSELQKEYNAYMHGRITYDAIETVLFYDEEYGDNRVLRSQLTDHLKENA